MVACSAMQTLRACAAVSPRRPVLSQAWPPSSSRLIPSRPWPRDLRLRCPATAVMGWRASCPGRRQQRRASRSTPRRRLLPARQRRTGSPRRYPPPDRHLAAIACLVGRPRWQLCPTTSRPLQRPSLRPRVIPSRDHAGLRPRGTGDKGRMIQEQRMLQKRLCYKFFDQPFTGPQTFACLLGCLNMVMLVFSF
jgi:hypothetical protein